jgi:hypothetical protein
MCICIHIYIFVPKTVGCSLGLRLVLSFLVGPEPQPWNPGTWNPYCSAVGLQSWVDFTNSKSICIYVYIYTRIYIYIRIYLFSIRLTRNAVCKISEDFKFACHMQHSPLMRWQPKPWGAIHQTLEMGESFRA